MCIETATAPNLQDALTAMKLQRFQHGASTNDHVVTLGQGTLQTRHVVSEF